MVFNDAVMNQRDFSRLIQMRMGVLIGRRPVGSPPCVADPGVSWGRKIAQQSRKLLNPARLPPQFKFAAVQNADAGGVVPSILQPPQAVEQDALGGLAADVADDAAHS